VIEDFVIKRNSALLWFVFAATLRAESCLLSVELVDQQSFFWGGDLDWNASSSRDEVVRAQPRTRSCGGTAGAPAICY